MRLVTFNVCSGRSSDGRFDVDRLAAAIATLEADVLSLQEVDRDQQRSGEADLTEVAAGAMGATHRVFVPSLYGTPGSHWTPAGDRPQEGPAYGCALLSRYPMRDVRTFHISAAPVAVPLWVPGSGAVVVREEPRVAIIAQLDLGTPSPVTVIGTHLPFVPLWNRWQLRRLAAEVRADPDPVLILGDLNLRGGTPARVTGFDSLASLPTFPSVRPRFQLDHVLLRGRLGQLGSVVAASAPPSAVSDHRPLVIDIELAT